MKKFYIGAAFVFVALVSVLLYGCSKEKDEIQEITVTVYGTIFRSSNPLQGASVKVSILKSGEGYQLVSRAVTGSDGTYEVTFTIKDDGNYPIKKGNVVAIPSGWTGYYDDCYSYFSYENTTKVRVDLNISE